MGSESSIAYCRSSASNLSELGAPSPIKFGAPALDELDFGSLLEQEEIRLYFATSCDSDVPRLP